MPADEAPARSVLCARLVAAVREAGAEALARFGGPLRSWTKEESSPVSEADIAANDILRERLTMPRFGWLSEESEDDSARLQARHLWIIDPIDGTRGYIAGKPDWSISAALVEDGRPVIAVLFAPVTDELFIALAGEGARHNGTPITVTHGGTLDGARVSGPRAMIERLTALAPQVQAMPRVHSLALRLARVAQGALDAAFAGGRSRDWDLAAADLLVHEAGGAITDHAGESLIYNRPVPVHGPLIAAGPERHQLLLGLLRGEH